MTQSNTHTVDPTQGQHDDAASQLGAERWVETCNQRDIDVESQRNLMFRLIESKGLLSKLVALRDGTYAVDGEAQPAAAPAATLDGLTDQQLLDGLRSRGLVVSAWSHEDLDFLYEAADLDHLETEQIDALKPAIFERLSSGLEDILSTRGNTHLDDKWGIESAAIIAELDIPKA